LVIAFPSTSNARLARTVVAKPGKSVCQFDGMCNSDEDQQQAEGLDAFAEKLAASLRTCWDAKKAGSSNIHSTITRPASAATIWKTTRRALSVPSADL